MDDLISRAAAIEAILGSFNAIRAIEELHTVDAVPMRHGRWITNKYGETVCSECDNNALQILTGCLVNRHFEPHKSKFCPNCGAKMDGERGMTMALLVDADKQLELVNRITPIHGIGLEPVVAVETVRDLIKGSRTVEAISVEWLENRREGLIFAAIAGSRMYGDNSIELCNAINMVLDMWQKEQEAHCT